MTGPQFTPRRDATTEQLCEDMTVVELTEILGQLRFGKDGHCLIVIDRGIRDFILHAVQKEKRR